MRKKSREGSVSGSSTAGEAASPTAAPSEHPATPATADAATPPGRSAATPEVKQPVLATTNKGVIDQIQDQQQELGQTEAADGQAGKPPAINALDIDVSPRCSAKSSLCCSPEGDGVLFSDGSLESPAEGELYSPEERVSAAGQQFSPDDIRTDYGCYATPILQLAGTKIYGANWDSPWLQHQSESGGAASQAEASSVMSTGGPQQTASNTSIYTQAEDEESLLVMDSNHAGDEELLQPLQQMQVHQSELQQPAVIEHGLLEASAADAGTESRLSGETPSSASGLSSTGDSSVAAETITSGAAAEVASGAVEYDVVNGVTLTSPMLSPGPETWLTAGSANWDSFINAPGISDPLRCSTPAEAVAWAGGLAGETSAGSSTDRSSHTIALPGAQNLLSTCNGSWQPVPQAAQGELGSLISSAGSEEVLLADHSSAPQLSVEGQLDAQQLFYILSEESMDVLQGSDDGVDPQLEGPAVTATHDGTPGSWQAPGIR
eukprot:gene11892-12036_t